MASILRQIVAGPRQKHPEAGLDLCYVTDNIIATSGPSSTFPQKAYRNPTDALVKFLDYKHGSEWAIWEFRAEGTGYPDSEVYGRIRHFPWPDHHPPPFALIPNIMASMRDWLSGPDTNIGRVVVVHCKAGKGRSGTAACSYLISEEGWKPEDALLRFTSRRMRLGFGAGVSIPSQLRWIRYVDRWTKNRKLYVERQVEVLEVHVWGLRDGVKVAVQGFVEEGRKIKNFHTFSRHERIIIEGKDPPSVTSPTTSSDQNLPLHDNKFQSSSNPELSTQSGDEVGGNAVIFRPAQPITLPTNDVKIDLERRNKATYGWTMVTSVAHVWFNAFFEGQGPENNGAAAPNGVFEIQWDAMDGIKGSARKGTKALDRIAIIWRLAESRSSGEPLLPRIITEPKQGEPVHEPEPADWKDAKHSNLTAMGGDLGLRAASPANTGVSQANSLRSMGSSITEGEEDYLVGVKSHGLNGEEHISHDVDSGVAAGVSDSMSATSDPGVLKVASPESAPVVGGEEEKTVGEVGLKNVAGVIAEMKDLKIDSERGGTAGEELKKDKQHMPG
ncbi:MAG: hypothetical protein Q9174_001715 [Haloplaca sp. 1 TL-2023]